MLLSFVEFGKNDDNIAANKVPDAMITFTVLLVAFPSDVQASTHDCNSKDITKHLSGVEVVVVVVVSQYGPKVAWHCGTHSKVVVELVVVDVLVVLVVLVVLWLLGWLPCPKSLRRLIAMSEDVLPEPLPGPMVEDMLVVDVLVVVEDVLTVVVVIDVLVVEEVTVVVKDVLVVVVVRDVFVVEKVAVVVEDLLVVVVVRDVFVVEKVAVVVEDVLVVVVVYDVFVVEKVAVVVEDVLVVADVLLVVVDDVVTVGVVDVLVVVDVFVVVVASLLKSKLILIV
jgi:hypothetical protein